MCHTAQGQCRQVQSLVHWKDQTDLLVRTDEFSVNCNHSRKNWAAQSKPLLNSQAGGKEVNHLDILSKGERIELGDICQPNLLLATEWDLAIWKHLVNSCLFCPTGYIQKIETKHLNSLVSDNFLLQCLLHILKKLQTKNTQSIQNILCGPEHFFLVTFQNCQWTEKIHYSPSSNKLWCL